MKNKVAGEEDGRSSGMEDELQRPGDNRQVEQKQQTSKYLYYKPIHPIPKTLRTRNEEEQFGEKLD